MRTRILAAVTGAVLLASMVPTTAHAEYYSIDDPADADASRADVHAMTARHGAERLAVSFQFGDLRRQTGAGIVVYVDTTAGRRGPEYLLSSGLGDGTDYVLTRARRWRDRGGPLDCDYSAQIRWDVDRFRAVIDRDCLGNPAEVRVSAKMVDHEDSSDPTVDWVPARRQWSLWLRPGRRVT
jgi:hypothetical protein